MLRILRSSSGFFIGMFGLSLILVLATDDDRFKINKSEPELHSVVPSGGRVGSSLAVEVRGKYLAGTYATWLSHDSFQAKVKSVEVVKPPASGDAAKKPPKDDSEYRVLLQITIAPDANPGPRSLSVVSPRGVSNRIYFQIYDDPVIAETEQPHHMPAQAQPVAVPVVVNGRISRQGELDYYSLAVTEAQELAFEVIFSREAMAKGFRPQLRLLESAESWFDSKQPKQLAFNSEVGGKVTGSAGTGWSFADLAPINSGLNYRFSKAGRYLVEVASERYQGKPDYAYQLRIVPVGSEYDRYLVNSTWRERSFTRGLSVDRLAALWARTVAFNQPTYVAVEGEPSSSPRKEAVGHGHDGKIDSPPVPRKITRWGEREPNDGQGHAMRVELPALIEGTIDRPEDIDYFTFKVTSSQRLAFEIETPELSPPHFNPRLEIRDAAGRSMLTNIHRMNEVKNPERWELKGNEPKVIETFDKEGEYSLEIRDATSRSGSPNCRYRLLIRPQIPHVGGITVETLIRGHEDHRIDPRRINLKRGEAKILNITTQIEEIDARVVEGGGQRAFDGGAGEITFLVEGLPEGVRAFPGTAILDIGGRPRHETVKRYSFLPDVQKTILVLRADPDAPLMILPESIRIVLHPLIDGQWGNRLLAAKLPLMVVAGSPKINPGDEGK